MPLITRYLAGCFGPCYGLTPVGSSASQSCLLPTVDGVKNRKGKSENAGGLRYRQLNR